MRLAGRAEDEATLRDAWQLCPAGADPAGAVLAAWRQLALQPLAASADRLEKIVDQLGLHWDGAAVADLCTQIEKLVGSQRPAPFAAAAIAGHVVAMRPDSELLAWWLADLVVAQSLRWPLPLPLLMGQVFWSDLPRGGHRQQAHPTPGETDLSARFAWRWFKQRPTPAGWPPSCRAGPKNSWRWRQNCARAGDVIFLLLSEDAVPGTLTTKNLSRFAARRLFERLQQLEAVREFTGRPGFRLFGRHPRQMQLANAFSRYLEMATTI